MKLIFFIPPSPPPPPAPLLQLTIHFDLLWPRCEQQKQIRLALEICFLIKKKRDFFLFPTKKCDNSAKFPHPNKVHMGEIVA